MRYQRYLLPAALVVALTTAACGQNGTPAKSNSSPVVPSSQSSAAATADPSSWTSLGPIRSLWMAFNRPGVAADPTADPGDLAVCRIGAVDVSTNGGATWTSVPTSDVVTATAASPYPVTKLAHAEPTCTSAVVDPAHPKTVYATFNAGKAPYGMPPVFTVPAYTTDGGQTWHIVSAPTGASAGTFGQFQVTPSGVAAIFAATASRSSAVVTETTDGGAVWHAADLLCPKTGPCLVWGPSASGIGSCAMNAYAQPIEASPNDGKTWTALPAPSGPGSPIPMLANGCGLNQLVALSATTVLLIGNGTTEPAEAVRLSHNSGKSWVNVPLPSLPGNNAPAGLQMLPNGTLISAVFTQTGATTYGDALALLKPGATTWCTVPNLIITNMDPSTLQAVGSSLWWNDGQGGAPQSKPLSQIQC